MRRGMISRGLLAAAAMLALTLLPFVHQPLRGNELTVVAHHHGGASADASSPVPAHDSSHTTCHACRIVVADIPAPPYPLAPTHTGSMLVVFAMQVPPLASNNHPTPHNPRAPPISG